MSTLYYFFVFVSGVSLKVVSVLVCWEARASTGRSGLRSGELKLSQALLLQSKTLLWTQDNNFCIFGCSKNNWEWTIFEVNSSFESWDCQPGQGSEQHPRHAHEDWHQDDDHVGVEGMHHQAGSCLSLSSLSQSSLVTDDSLAIFSHFCLNISPVCSCFLPPLCISAAGSEHWCLCDGCNMCHKALICVSSHNSVCSQHPDNIHS